MTNKFISMMDGFRQGIASSFGTRLLRFDSVSIVSRQSLLPIFLLCLTLFIGAGQMWGADVSYDFTNISGFSSWGSSYSSHTVEYTEADVIFASANKQTSTITDRPVTKGGDVELKLKGTYKTNYYISAVTFTCKQWGSKAQTITLHSSTNGGSTYTTTGTTSTNFTISKNSLTSGTNAVKITFSSSSNQVGISSVSFTLTALSTGCSNTPTMSFTPNSVEKTVGDDNFTKAVSISGKGSGQTVSYSSSNTSVATVNSSTGEVTIKTNGSTTITASVAESGDYCSASASYTLTVNKPSYTVNWFVGGTQVKTESVTKDETATLPSTPADNALGGSCSSLKFMGWSETNIGSNGTTAPADLFTAAPTITSAKNFYAVFAEGDSDSEEQTLSFDASNFGLTNSYAVKTCTVDGYSFKVDKGYLNGTSNIQMNSSQGNGKLYNTTSIPGLKSVRLNVASGSNTKTVYSGSTSGSTTHNLGTTTSSSKTFEVEEGDTYFTIQVSGANYLSSVVVTYEETTFVASNYRTSCCSSLGSINGSFFWPTLFSYLTC